MASVNRVTLIGYLGQDPEIRYTASGDAVANISMATGEQWKDKDAGKQEKTEWHRIVLFGRIAEVCGEYLKKGSQAYFEGKLQTRKWTDKEGQDRYTTEIVAFTMKMLGGRTESVGNRPPPQGENNAPAASGGGKSGFDDMEDDIPF